MQDERPTLIVDGNNLAYRIAHSVGRAGLSSDGESTGVIFGCLKSIVGLIQEHRTGAVVLCWDNGRPLWRSQLVPTYKTQRDREKLPPEELAMKLDVERQMNLLHDAANSLGIISVKKSFVEADDLVAAACTVLGGKKIVLSGDEDMQQLASSDVLISHPARNTMSDHRDVFDRTGVSVVLYPAYRALVGDSSDNLAGAPGIGPVKAKKLLDQFASEATSSIEALRLIRVRSQLIPEAVWPQVMNTFQVMNLQQQRPEAQAAVLAAVDRWSKFDQKGFYDLIKCYRMGTLADAYIYLSRLGQPTVSESFLEVLEV